MDQLQNQINQVLLMLQNNPQEFTVATLPHMAGKFTFIASFSSKFLDIWIIDNGATDHVCTLLHLMHNKHTLKQPILVNLPNGHQIKVDTIGSVKISPTLTITGVFYILTFTYNLISISKLTASTHSAITFTNKQCTFQGYDGSVAYGSLHGGLYTLNSSPTPTISTINSHTSTTHLWHSRHGHPCSQVL
ncbi:hypothetical protein Tco_0619719 [Tanacetum coccineum]